MKSKRKKQQLKLRPEMKLFLAIVFTLILAGFTYSLFSSILSPTGLLTVNLEDPTTTSSSKQTTQSKIIETTFPTSSYTISDFSISANGNTTYRPGFNITYGNGSCPPGSTDILHIFKTNNSHAQLPNATGYNITVCAEDSTGADMIYNTNGTLWLRLFNYTNSHVMIPNQTGYNTSAYIGSSGDNISCVYVNSSGVCPQPGNQSCVVTLEDYNNSHVATCDEPYDISVCCGFEYTPVAAGNITSSLVNGTCPANTTDILHMSFINNSHVELANETNYNYSICVGDTTGRNNISWNTSSGEFNIIDMSNTTNAHVELPDQVNYSIELFINASEDDFSCSYPLSYGNCSLPGQACLFTLSTNLTGGFTNLHASSCTDAYETTVCCGFATQAGNIYLEPIHPFTLALNETGAINTSILNNTAYKSDQYIRFIDTAGRNYMRIRALFSSADVNASDLVIEVNDTAISANTSNVTGIGNIHALYLNNTNNNNGIFICPNAESLSQITFNCTGKINITGPQIGQVLGNYLVSTSSGQYMIDGLSSSAVALGTFASLTLTDDTDSQSKGINQIITLKADYEDSNSNDLTTATCNITYHDGQTELMTYNSTLSAYISNKTYNTNGTFAWNVTCNQPGYETLFANDTVYINSPPTISQGILNSTFGTNYTTENLTVYTNTYDSENDSIKNIYNWYVDGQSTTVLNMPFEGGSNSTYTKDYSGYANDGTIINQTTFNPTGGYDGKGAYEFDGVGDAINIPDSDSLNVTGTSFSIEVRVLFNNLNLPDGAGMDIVDKADLNDAGYQLDLFREDAEEGTILFFIIDDNYAESARYDYSNLNTGQWYHIVGTYDGSFVRLYINGVEVNSSPETNTMQGSNSDLRIGSNNDGYFNGSIDEVKIYNIALSPEQIRTLNNNRTNTISLNETIKGQTWNVSVTPNDGLADGTTVFSNSVKILNSIPSTPAINLTPISPVYTHDLTCSVITSSTDADNDPISYHYLWSNGTTPIWQTGPTAATSDTLGSGNTSAGDIINCTVTPFDNQDNGTSVWISRLINDNPPPSVTQPNIQPDPAYTNNNINISTTYTDPWGEDGTVFINWTVDSILVRAVNYSVSNNSVVNDILPSSNFTKNQNIIVYVYAIDNQTKTSQILNDSITISNTPPIQPTIAIIPALPRSQDNLICSVTINSTDTDNDISNYTFQWFNGTTQFTQSAPKPGSDTLPSANTAPGETWNCTVTPFDGQDNGTSISAQVTINYPPSVTQPNIQPDPAYTNNALGANATYTDTDGDSGVLYINWTVDGTVVRSNNYALADGATIIDGLPSTNFNKSHNVTIYTYAYDNKSDASIIRTDSIIISNTPPTAPVVTTPATSSAGAAILCSITTQSTDTDLDSINYTFEWYKNGTLNTSTYTTQLNNTLATAITKTGEIWNCTVTPFDGEENGTSGSGTTTAITPDTTLPTSVIDQPLNMQAIGQNSIPFTINGTANDDVLLNYVQLSINSSLINATGTTDWNYVWNPAGGEVQLFSQAYDISDNAETALETINVAVFPTSTIFGSFATNATIEFSTLDGSTVNDSDVLSSNVNGSLIDPSTVVNSNTTDSNITDSTVNTSTILTSSLNNCTVNESTINLTSCTDSKHENSSVRNSTILHDTKTFNATIVDDQCVVGVIIYQGVYFSCPDNLTNIYFPAAPPEPATQPTTTGGGSTGGGGGSSACRPVWECTDWSECSAGIETRTCTDRLSCANKFAERFILGDPKPNETRSCGTSETDDTKEDTDKTPVKEDKEVEDAEKEVEPKPPIERTPKFVDTIITTFKSLPWMIIGIIIAVLIAIALLGTAGIAVYRRMPESKDVLLQRKLLLEQIKLAKLYLSRNDQLSAQEAYTEIYRLYYELNKPKEYFNEIMEINNNLRT